MKEANLKRKADGNQVKMCTQTWEAWHSEYSPGEKNRPAGVEGRGIVFKQSGVAGTSSGQRPSGNEPGVEGKVRTAGLYKHTKDFGLYVERDRDPEKFWIERSGG